MQNLTIFAALLVLALGQLHAQITTYHDTLPDGTTIILVDSGQPPIELMIDSMFGSLDFTEVSSADLHSAVG